MSKHFGEEQMLAAMLIGLVERGYSRQEATRRLQEFINHPAMKLAIAVYDERHEELDKELLKVAEATYKAVVKKEPVKH